MLFLELSAVMCMRVEKANRKKRQTSKRNLPCKASSTYSLSSF